MKNDSSKLKHLKNYRLLIKDMNIQKKHLSLEVSFTKNSL